MRNSSKFAICGTGLLLLAGLVVWILSRHNVEPSGNNRHEKKELVSISGEQSSDAKALEHVHAAEVLQTALLQQIAHDKVSPKLLLAVYELTHDPKIRERLKALRPHNATVAAVLSLSAVSAEDKLEWAKIWMECDPENSAGVLIAAELLSKSSDSSAFNTLIHKLAAGKPVDLYHESRELEMQESLTRAGIEARKTKDKVSSAIGTTTMPLLQAALTVADVLKSSDLDPVEAASKAVAISRSLSAMKGLPASQALVATGIEVALLKKLDPAVEYGESGTTVGERVAEIQASWKQRMKILEGAEQAYENANETIRGMYEERVQVYGEVEAAEWLLKQ